VRIRAAAPSRHRARRPLLRAAAPRAALAVLLLLASPALAEPAAEGSEDELDLVGTWYVRVHYTDADAAYPEREHWEDRLWVFERSGSRLRWTDYPIVVFSDTTGRFERSSHGLRRVVHAWTPNTGQREQIEAGLEFNTRGAKTKTLRRQRDGSWQSASARQAMSASVVGYHETWTIEGLPDAPVFRRDDVLGSLRAESMSGRTTYATEEISPGGSRLRGSYARDESRRGSFRMMRSGEAKSVGTKRSQEERTREALRRGWQDADDGSGAD